MTQPVGDLAAAINQATNLAYDPATIRKGVVSSIDTPTISLGITLSGDSTVITGVNYVASYHPTIGDTVLVCKQGNTIVVIDKIADTYVTAADGYNYHTHLDNIEVNNTTVSVSDAGLYFVSATHTGSRNTHAYDGSKTVSGIGLDSGLNYNAVATGNTGAPTNMLFIGLNGVSSSSITITVARLNDIDTGVQYIISQEFNPII